MRFLKRQQSELQSDLEQFRMLLYRGHPEEEIARLRDKIIAYGEKAVPLLTPILDDPQDVLRLDVPEILGHIGGDKAAYHLLDYVHEPQMRYQVVQALQRIKTPYAEETTARVLTRLQREADTLIILIREVHKSTAGVMLGLPEGATLLGNQEPGKLTDRYGRGVEGSVLAPTLAGKVKIEGLPLFATGIISQPIPVEGWGLRSWGHMSLGPPVLPPDESRQDWEAKRAIERRRNEINTAITNRIKFNLKMAEDREDVHPPFLISGRQDLSLTRVSVIVEMKIDTWAEFPDLSAKVLAGAAAEWGPPAKNEPYQDSYGTWVTREALSRVPAAGEAIPIFVADRERDVYGLLQLQEPLEGRRFVAELLLSQPITLEPGWPIRRRVTLVWANQACFEAQVAEVVAVH